MKEASGEANMTVVTILLIGVVGVAATTLINGVLTNSERRMCCVNDGGEWKNSTCSNGKSYAKGCSQDTTTGTTAVADPQ